MNSGMTVSCCTFLHVATWVPCSCRNARIPRAPGRTAVCPSGTEARAEALSQREFPRAKAALRPVEPDAHPQPLHLHTDPRKQRLGHVTGPGIPGGCRRSPFSHSHNAPGNVQSLLQARAEAQLCTAQAGSGRLHPESNRGRCRVRASRRRGSVCSRAHV